MFGRNAALQPPTTDASLTSQHPAPCGTSPAVPARQLSGPHGTAWALSGGGLEGAAANVEEASSQREREMNSRSNTLLFPAQPNGGVRGGVAWPDGVYGGGSIGSQGGQSLEPRLSQSAALLSAGQGTADGATQLPFHSAPDADSTAVAGMGEVMLGGGGQDEAQREAGVGSIGVVGIQGMLVLGSNDATAVNAGPLGGGGASRSVRQQELEAEVDTELQHMLTVAAQPDMGRAGSATLRGRQAAPPTARRRAELPAAASDQLLNQNGGRDYGAHARQLPTVERFCTPVSWVMAVTAEVRSSLQQNIFQFSPFNLHSTATSA